MNDNSQLYLLKELQKYQIKFELFTVNLSDTELNSYNYISNFIKHECNILTGIANIATNTYDNDHNICMFGRIFVDCNGDVYPCIKTMEYDFGNFRKDEFGLILYKVEEYWENIKLKNKKCLSCNYSLNCNRCVMKTSNDEMICTASL